ncbi:Ig-like domain-containing protein [Thiolapillus sp.]
MKKIGMLARSGGHAPALLAVILLMEMVLAVGHAAPVAIPMTYQVAMDRQKFIALAAYSSDISYVQARYSDNPIQWGVRYREAIDDWRIQALPSHGILYDGATLLQDAGTSITDPDELLYVPNKGFQGRDSFAFSVSDSHGISQAATVTLMVEASISPPAGIPAFPAIFHTPAPTPGSGNTETDDWYIDNSHPVATDEPQAGESSPRHGTPDRPRLTLPPNNSSLVAGSRVFIGGGVETPYTIRSGWHRWYALGQAGEPIYILGKNDGPRKPVITGDDGDQLRLQMQFTVFDGLHIAGIAIYPRAGQDGGNIVFRHSVIDGMQRRTTGSGISLNQGDNNVFYDLHIKNSGRTEPDLSDENDVHGIQVSRSNVWIIDNLIHGSAGDAIQINGEFAQGIYIGRNKLHSDNENALDFKRRYDLVFVENDVWDYRAIAYASSGSDGVPVIINQDTNGQTPIRSIIARNRIWDANGGIRHQGQHIWTMDNVLWQLHRNTNTTARSYAITVGNNGEYGYTDRIVNNTMHRVDGGIFIWAGANGGTIDHQYLGNNFGLLNDASLEKLHFNINSNHDDGTLIDYNNYLQPALIRWASRLRSLEWMRANTTSSVNSVENRDPRFRDAANFDLRLQLGSPLIDANAEHVAYEELWDQYQRLFALDADNVSRPRGNNWDVGAYEYHQPILFADGFEG